MARKINKRADLLDDKSWILSNVLLKMFDKLQDNKEFFDKDNVNIGDLVVLSRHSSIDKRVCVYNGETKYCYKFSYLCSDENIFKLNKKTTIPYRVVCIENFVNLNKTQRKFYELIKKTLFEYNKNIVLDKINFHREINNHFQKTCTIHLKDLSYNKIVYYFVETICNMRTTSSTIICCFEQNNIPRFNEENIDTPIESFNLIKKKNV